MSPATWVLSWKLGPRIQLGFDLHLHQLNPWVLEMNSACSPVCVTVKCLADRESVSFFDAQRRIPTVSVGATMLEAEHLCVELTFCLVYIHLLAVWLWFLLIV